MRNRSKETGWRPSLRNLGDVIRARFRILKKGGRFFYVEDDKDLSGYDTVSKEEAEGLPKTTEVTRITRV